MRKFLNKEKLRNWAITHASGPHGKFWLSALSFAESSFFPIPPDILLIGILLTKERYRWIYYSLLTTVFSVLGGLFGYMIGYIFFNTFGESILSLYDLEEKFIKVSQLFSGNAFATMFVAAFTPIPYKVFTITAGVFKINIFSFIIASVLGRGIRFLAVGLLMKLYGERIARVLYKYFNIFSMILVILIGILIYLIV